MSVTNSANMSLPIPVPGQENGPQWAIDLNNCLTFIDQHDHSAGSGVQITPAGININADLAINGNNLANIRAARFANQGAALSLPQDLNQVYVIDGDLWFNDGNGAPVRITALGAVAGTPGSIANLVSPASASYVVASAKFVWQSDSNTSADMDFGSALLRNPVPSSKALTLAPPNAMANDYQITLPTLPLATSIMTMTSSGVQAANLVTDNSTIEVSSNSIRVKDLGITAGKLAADSVVTSKILDANVTTPKIADLNVTQAKRAAASIAVSGPSGQVDLGDNLTGFTTICTTPDIPCVGGRPVLITVTPNSANTIGGACIELDDGTECQGEIVRNGNTSIGLFRMKNFSTQPEFDIPWTGVFMDTAPPAGNNSYILRMRNLAGFGAIIADYFLTAVEL